MRKYKQVEPSRDIIDGCIEAARLSPSACNSQPWEFIILYGKRKDEAADKVFCGIYSASKFAKSAPVLVFVVRNLENYIIKLADFLRDIRFSLIDIGIACEHFVLQAAEKGLGTCIIGWFDERMAKKILRLPGGKRVDLIISVGYPDSKEEHRKGRKPIEDARVYL